MALRAMPGAHKVTVLRERSTVNTLDSLEVAWRDGDTTIVPRSSDTVLVPNHAGKVTVTAWPTNRWASVSVDGTTVQWGTAGDSIQVDLIDGKLLSVVVISEAGIASQRTYSLFVDPYVPTPSGVSVTPVENSHSLEVQWQDNSTGETGFTVIRYDPAAGSGGLGLLPFDVDANTESYIDEGLDGGATYIYEVYAYVSYNGSEVSSAPSDTAAGSPYVRLDISAQTGGSVSPAAGTHYYSPGAEVEIEATPEAQYAFDGWSGGITTTQNPHTLTLNHDITVAAGFCELITWYVDADTDGFPSAAATISSCTSPGSEYTAASELQGTEEDCDDQNAAVNPETQWWIDEDGDGATSGVSTLQCARPVNGKLAEELDYPTLDFDCDDQNPELNPGTQWWVDADDDGWPSAEYATRQCSRPADGKLLSELDMDPLTDDFDCDDNDGSVQEKLPTPSISAFCASVGTSPDLATFIVTDESDHGATIMYRTFVDGSVQYDWTSTTSPDTIRTEYCDEHTSRIEAYVTKTGYCDSDMATASDD